MKKNTIIIVLVIAILATALCGCGNNTQPAPDTSATATTTTDPSMENEIDVSIFPEVEATYENLEIYREEVTSRLESLKEDESFITDEDWEAISNSEWLTDSKYRHNTYFTSFSDWYEETTEYYYPVVFKDGSILVLWYTTEYGSLHFEKIHGYGSIGGNYGGQVHHDTSDEETITSKTEYTITYAQETGEVKVWQFGEVKETFSGIPEGSIYCGFSRFEGYIFRNGTDVYSLNAADTYNADGSVVCIAHNVEYVIDADYYYGSDPWCQPLFLMTNGSIKAYIGWEGDQDTPDSTTHLCDLQYEGSWDK